MSRIIYHKCDWCGKEFRSLTTRSQRFLHLSCGTDTLKFPHGDFCSIECLVKFLNVWLAEPVDGYDWKTCSFVEIHDADE